MKLGLDQFALLGRTVVDRVVKLFAQDFSGIAKARIRDLLQNEVHVRADERGLPVHAGSIHLANPTVLLVVHPVSGELMPGPFPGFFFPDQPRFFLVIVMLHLQSVAQCISGYTPPMPEKEKPLWQRLYQPECVEIVRIIGHAGTTYRSLMEKAEPLKKQFGGEKIDSAIFFFASFEGDRAARDVKPLTPVSLREEVRKVCCGLLGYPPGYKEVSTYEMIWGYPEGQKPEEKSAEKLKKERKPRKKKIPGEKPVESPNGSNSTELKTPLMAQYREAKERHPGMLLLFRMGDFYELFEGDAEIASRVLGLTLTSRNGSSMAGFPYHQLEAYLQKLLKVGHRVAVCDQVDSADGKEVTRVVTPENLAQPA